MKKLVLSYRRLHETVDGEYPYTGDFSLLEGDEKKEHLDFVQLTFKDIVRQLHRYVVKEPAVRVIFQRTEREDILPMELTQDLVKLLREDPLSAWRAMTHEPAKGNHDVLSRLLSQESTRRAEVFGEVIYIDMANGYILDPLTGEWKSMAYGEKQGWRINAGDNRSDSWVQVDVVDDSPKGTQFAFRLAFARWAVVSVYTLLARQAERYYLPRAWNPNGPWISYKDLKALLEEQQKKEA